jgi:hypothetical protein
MGNACPDSARNSIKANRWLVFFIEKIVNLDFKKSLSPDPV